MVPIPNKFGVEVITAKIKCDVFEYVLKKDVTTGVAMITSISGLRNAPMNIAEQYVANPYFKSDEANYKWIVTPSEDVNQRPQEQANFITFKKPGTYTITCIAESKNCLAQTTPPPHYIVVSVGGYYSVSSKLGYVTIAKSNLERSLPNDMVDNSSMEYEVYNQGTGALSHKGTAGRSGGTLDFSNLRKGFYILNLQISKDINETHKFVIK
ncbi:MAG: hypothetical protein LUH63_14645 [Parabacteroides sp.]|nr:hypothetical protein [Parabacteroides sp.]